MYDGLGHVDTAGDVKAGDVGRVRSQVVLPDLTSGAMVASIQGLNLLLAMMALQKIPEPSTRAHARVVLDEALVKVVDVTPLEITRAKVCRDDVCPLLPSIGSSCHHLNCSLHSALRAAVARH